MKKYILLIKNLRREWYKEIHVILKELKVENLQKPENVRLRTTDSGRKMYTKWGKQYKQK